MLTFEVFPLRLNIIQKIINLIFESGIPKIIEEGHETPPI